MRFGSFLISAALTSVVSLGEYGLCLDGIQTPENGQIACDPPNRLPQICSLNCNQGFYKVGSTGDFVCSNAICTNQCQAENGECSGLVPFWHEKTCENADEVYDCSYKDYRLETRDCCTLKQIEAPYCDIGNSCTGNCSQPGIYTYDSLTCPEVCIPWRETTTPQFSCKACVLPALAGNVVLESKGSPVYDVLVGCPLGTWGAPVQSVCTVTGDWYPLPRPSCQSCSAVPYDLRQFDAEYVVVSQTPGEVKLTCKPHLVGTPATMKCNQRTGVWDPLAGISCDIPPSPEPTSSVTPSISPSSSIVYEPSVTPSQSTAVTPSPSKTPRPPKIKGSRAPSPAPKLAGSRAPDSRGLRG
jgi:hypothetical protein